MLAARAIVELGLGQPGDLRRVHTFLTGAHGTIDR